MVQLPLPKQVDTERVLSTISLKKDADVLSKEAMEKFEDGDFLLPPIVGAIAEIIDRENIVIEGKHVVIVGKGRLVGAPSRAWFSKKGVQVDSLDRNTEDISVYTKEADIMVLGAGKPGIITPEIIKDGVVMFDAATSETKGLLKGDVDPACSEKASVFTPVPGGIGPITVAKLFENLLELSKEANERNNF